MIRLIVIIAVQCDADEPNLKLALLDRQQPPPLTQTRASQKYFLQESSPRGRYINIAIHTPAPTRNQFYGKPPTIRKDPMLRQSCLLTNIEPETPRRIAAIESGIDTSGRRRLSAHTEPSRPATLLDTDAAMSNGTRVRPRNHRRENQANRSKKVGFARRQCSHGPHGLSATIGLLSDCRAPP
jgi:hypothetical protein